MSLARLIAWAPVFILLLVAAPLAHAAENEQVAAEIRKIIDNGEPLMGDQQSG